jgi:osmoprotectant transport system substrate-binding protein
MLHRRTFLSLSSLSLLSLYLTVACGTEPPTPAPVSIKVGSKDFTEQFILGEIYALTLEQAGFTVERKLNLGGSPVAHAALQSGGIDLYPEYTGTALLTILKQKANSDPQIVATTVATEYQRLYNLKWLAIAPMNNTQALAMTKAGAEKYGIQKISDLVTKASQLTMIGPPEFEVREDGLPGLKVKYGKFELKAYKAVDAGLRYRALKEGSADVAVAFGTDGEIAAMNLVVLADDRQLFPPYQVAPVVRQAIVDANPKLATALDAIAPKLTTEVMQKLNFEVSGKNREPAEVAKEFLVNIGILPKA